MKPLIVFSILVIIYGGYSIITGRIPYARKHYDFKKPVLFARTSGGVLVILGNYYFIFGFIRLPGWTVIVVPLVLFSISFILQKILDIRLEYRRREGTERLTRVNFRRLGVFVPLYVSY